MGRKVIQNLTQSKSERNCALLLTLNAKKCTKKGHYTRFCKSRDIINKPKDTHNKETVRTNSVAHIAMFGVRQRIYASNQVMHSMRVGQDMRFRRQLKQRRSVTLSNEEFDKVLQKFVKKPAAPPPTIKITVRLDIAAYVEHDPVLDARLTEEFLNKLKSRGEPMPPHQVTATTDTGAQAIIMGHTHLEKMGLDMSSLHMSSVTMDCANSTAMNALGVFYGYIRGKCRVTGNTLLHRGMVYVVEGDIVLLSETALKDLGVIPVNFPQIGQFGGTIEPDDGMCRFDQNMQYDPDQSHKPLQVGRAGVACQTQVPDSVESPDIPTIDDAKAEKNDQSQPIITDAGDKSKGPGGETCQAPTRQPLGQCDPESSLPCSCPRRCFMDPPESLPMPATTSNIPALEDWIKNYYKTSAFNQCNRQTWPITTGKPMKIHLKPGTKPYCCKKPTMVPMHYRDQVKADLEADVKKGVLERVPEGIPDTWCSRMVIQPKKNGKARRTVDLSYLSKHSIEESHHTRSAPMIAKSVPADKYKSTLDCVDGYHGIELAEEDRHMTTFATEWGKYRYRRAPQGWLSSGNSYGRSTDDVMEDCPSNPDVRDWEKIVDDIINWTESVEEAFHRICSIISHCNKHGMVFSAAKFKFARREVEFAGFMITDEGIKPVDKYTDSIRNFPTPKNITEVRSWYGLINQVAYCFCKTETMAPFRHLLSPGTEFVWTDELEKSFVASKAKIIELIQEGVYSFDPKLITCLSTDYSKEGMGWMLQQKICSCEKISPTCCPTGWRLVLAGGAFCNQAEKNYSPIEGEATAIFKGLKDTKYYTLGCMNLYPLTINLWSPSWVINLWLTLTTRGWPN